MAEWAFRIVPGLLFLSYAALRFYYGGQWMRREKVERRSPPLERVANNSLGLGHLPAVLYFTTHWLDPFYVHIPPVLRAGGVLLLLLGEILLFVAHLSLRENWSPYLEVRQGHTLTTTGLYRYVRHPMYAAFYLMGFGLFLASANWLVGVSFLGPLTLVYLTRVAAEEKMIRDRFGDAYTAYSKRTGRLLPRVTKRLLIPALVLAVAGIVACAAIVVDGLSDDLGKADVAVVLGNRVYGNGQPGPTLKSRLDTAVRLYREGWFPEIFVSGGIDRDGRDEAAVMQSYLIAKGIPAERIQVDSQGQNTRATAVNAAAFMKERGLKTAMVVTQYYHVPRARMAMKMAGVSTVYAAHASHFNWKDVYAVPRELIALAWYRVGGNGTPSLRAAIDS